MGRGVGPELTPGAGRESPECAVVGEEGRKGLSAERARVGQAEIPLRWGLRVGEGHLTPPERITLSFASAVQGERPMVAVSPDIIPRTSALPQTAVSLDAGLISGTLDSLI